MFCFDRHIHCFSNISFSFFTPIKVRREPDVQELRQWQREWREENRGIQSRVSDFWEKKMPDWDKPTPNASEDQLNKEDTPITTQSPTKQT